MPHRSTDSHIASLQRGNIMSARHKYLSLLSLLLIWFSCSQAQSPTPTPDQRGLEIQSSQTKTPGQSDQQGREQKPELVLQSGYNSLIGATRFVFSPDGRLLATGTTRSTTIKLWDTSKGRELRDLSTGGQAAIGLSPVFAFSRD